MMKHDQTCKAKIPVTGVKRYRYCYELIDYVVVQNASLQLAGLEDHLGS
jgi:hypothetical protein